MFEKSFHLIDQNIFKQKIYRYYKCVDWTESRFETKIHTNFVSIYLNIHAAGEEKLEIESSKSISFFLQSAAQ